MREVSVSLDAAISATAAAGTAANPFEAAESLQACRGAMQELEQWIAADAGWFNDAVASVREAERQLGSLTDLAARSQQDQVPDSQEIAAVVRAVPGLTESLRQCRERLDEAHGDWPALDADADAISSEAARLRGILGGELEQAEQSALALQRAASAIRALHGWSGSFGLVAGRDAGQREFQAAREALARGDYPEAARLAVLTATGAQNALDAAEAAERRERRERERRAEEARRATESRSRSAASFGSQSSFGRSPSSAGSGGSSSPSGAARSSFNSGSGTSRSGW